MSPEEYQYFRDLLKSGNPEGAIAILSFKKITPSKVVPATLALLSAVSMHAEKLAKDKKNRELRDFYFRFVHQLKKTPISQRQLNKMIAHKFKSAEMMRIVKRYNSRVASYRNLEEAMWHRLYLHYKSKKKLFRMWYHPLTREVEVTSSILLPIWAILGGLYYFPADFFEDEKDDEDLSDFAQVLFSQYRAMVFSLFHKKLGYAVFFDKNRTERALGPKYFELKKQLSELDQSSPQYKVKVTEMATFLNSKLTGDYDDDHKRLSYKNDKVRQARTRRVTLSSSFVDSGRECYRGVCRHKALTMVALLKENGIEARYQRGKVKNRGYHAWVHLPGLEMVSDPTWDELLKDKTYYDENIEQETLEYRTIGEFEFDWAIDF